MSAVGGALLAPAAPMAADEPPAAKSAPAAGATVADDAAAPRAVLSVTPARPLAGEPVHLDASRSSGDLVAYAWDLDGDGAFEASTGSRAAVEHVLAAGDHEVAVRVEDAAGRSDQAGATVTVAEAPAEAAAQPRAPKAEPRFDAKPRVREAPRASKSAQPAGIRAAASSSVAIRDFAFSPSSVTVDVGDTVTWSNQDDAPHTATGDGGSFNTGTLDKGESGSHTFQSAGSFSYICAIHPNMKGTVVVQGAGSGGGGTGGGTGGDGSGGDPGSGGSTSPSSSGAGTDSGALPHTGLQLLAVALTGVLMTGLGVGLRLLVAAAPARRRSRG
jgi:plastocyanin